MMYDVDALGPLTSAPDEIEKHSEAGTERCRSVCLQRFWFAEVPRRAAERIRECLQSHKLLATVLAVTLSLPMLLSPSHPVAVYGFLIHRYAVALTESPGRSSHDGLEAFLVSSGQIDRYRRESCEDMLDTGGGRLFAIVRTSGGAYRQEAVRTWNSFLSPALSSRLGQWLDYKEIPYLGDEVRLWLRGDALLAMGHYHPFGGVPSAGDALARRFSVTSEVVVSNGLIPFTYLDGKLIAYGSAERMTTEVFRSLRAMEKSVTMTPKEVPVSISAPSDALQALVVYLRDGRQIDVSDKSSIARAVKKLCVEFKADYASAFERGYAPNQYPDDLDRFHMLSNLSNVELWACSTRTVWPLLRSPKESGAAGAVDGREVVPVESVWQQYRSEELALR